MDQLKIKTDEKGATLTIHENGCINAVISSNDFIMTSLESTLEENINAVYDFLEKI